MDATHSSWPSFNRHVLDTISHRVRLVQGYLQNRDLSFAGKDNA